MPPIRVDNLGEGGVDVDTDPIRTADNSTSESQNAIYDTTRKRLGGLTKRPGFARFNTVPLGAPVLGGTEGPFAGFAKAPPGGGGGPPGSPSPTGDPPPVDPGPGGGPPPGGPAGPPAPPSGPFGPIFNGRRLIAVGRADNTIGDQNGEGWWVSTVGFADSALITTSQATGGNGLYVPVGPPSETGVLVGLAQNGDVGQPASTIANGILYYSRGHSETPSTSPVFPSIAKFDGKVDQIIATVPKNPLISGTGPAPSFEVGIGSIVTKWGDGSILYFTVIDRVTAGGGGGGTAIGKYGRVMQLDVSNGQLTELFNSLHTYGVVAIDQRPPYLVFNYSGNVWFGTLLGTPGADSGTIAMLQPDGTAYDGFNPTNFHTFTSANVCISGVTCQKKFQGLLYLGFLARTNGATDFAYINAVSIDNSVTLGVGLTASGGVAVDKNYFVSMRLFKGNLYASYYNPTQTAKIYKWDGTTWSTVFTSSGVTDRVPYNLITDGDDELADTSSQDYLYAYGSLDLTQGGHFLVTTDGTTWTDKSANFVRSSTFLDYPINVLYGFNQ